jgi:quercetin 2,3-dioxygenase
MLAVRQSKDRGHADHGWLKSYHTFSFADYYDPKFMAFSELRVINEDFIEGGGGFQTHPHKDMEIVTYVISGALAHKDTLGNSEVIRPGEVQRMSAGTGIRHSEFNSSETETCHLLQIWILPEKENIKPSYEQTSFSERFEKENFVLVGSRDGQNGSVTIHQDLKLYVGKYTKPMTLDLPVSAQRKAWLQVVAGSLTANNLLVSAGDGLAIDQEAAVSLKATAACEFLFFDMP